MTTIPVPLTKNDLGDFRQLLAHDQLESIYDELAARGYRYAALANGVVKGNTFSGRIALEFLRKTAEDQHLCLPDAAVDAIRLALAGVYLDTLGLQCGSGAALVTRDVLAEEAWRFHSDVFQNQGLGADAWTLNQPFTLMADEERQVYWTYTLGGAGEFAREIVLGVATDVIMKQAALDPLAPIAAGDAWRWLRRLHNLDTYLTATEFAGAWLDQQAMDWPATLSSQRQNGEHTFTIKPILDQVDHAFLDDELITRLSSLDSRILDPRHSSA